jgi:hypothetical protein
MTIDHGRIKALFQAAIGRQDPAERAHEVTSTASEASRAPRRTSSNPG